MQFNMVYLIHLFIFLLKISLLVSVDFLLNSYTIITLPIYSLFQKPEKVLKASNRTRSRRIKFGNSKFAYYVPKWNPISTVADDVKTIVQLFDSIGKYISLDRPALGYREVMNQKAQIASGPSISTIGNISKLCKLSDYKWITYKQMVIYSKNIAKRFYSCGVRRYDKFILFCDTCVDYFLVQLAIAQIGAIQVNVFSTIGPKGLLHILKETNAKFAFVSLELLIKLKSIAMKNRFNLRLVFYIQRKNKDYRNGLYKVRNVYYLPLNCIDCDVRDCADVSDSLRPLRANQIAYIVYTSGTTGDPKGVLATPRQFVNEIKAMMPFWGHLAKSDQNVYMAYLPQAHIFETTSELSALVLGTPLAFGHPSTLTGSSPGLMAGAMSDVKAARPTIMIAVPLVLERIRKSIHLKLSKKSPLVTEIFNYFMEYKIHWMEKGLPLFSHLNLINWFS